MLDTLLQDLRYALRTLRAERGFTAVALLTIALGIGANTAVFSVVSGILLAPLPFPAPERLIAIWPGHFTSNAELDYLQRHAQTFDAASFSPGWDVALTRQEGASRLAGARTSANFFRVLGARPLLGRTFADGESAPGAPHVALLSYQLWQTAFGGDSGILGRRLTLDGFPATVIGVMPPEFRFVQQKAELWQPLEVDPSSPFWTGDVSFLLGRLRSGSTLGAANGELAASIAPMRQTFHFEAAYGRGARVTPLSELIVGDLRITLVVLLGAVGFIVLIAGANVGNLLLARAAGRRLEMAIRAALGARRRRIVRQLLSESLLLAAGGGLLGLALGALGVRVLKAVLPADVPRLGEVQVDVRVLLMCAAVTILVGALFGLAPALLASRTDLQSALRGRAASGGGVFGRRMRGSLVAAELALALVLVIGAALMIQTLRKLSTVDPGFRADGVLTMQLQPTGEGYQSRERRVSYFTAVMDRLRAVPGVLDVGMIHFLPLTGFDWHNDVEIESKPRASGESPFLPGYRTAGGDYFRVMHIPLIAGRTFAASDVAGAPGVAIVSESFARQVFGADGVSRALGQRIRAGLGTRKEWVTIIGVVGGVRYRALATEPEPEFYLAMPQFPQGSTAIVVRTATDPMRSARVLHDVVASVDRAVPIADIRSLDELVSSSIAQPRVLVLLFLVFALVGLALGAVGIYGVVSYAVNQRVREIGIRVALGAGHTSILSLVLGEGMRHALAGVGLGLAAAFGLARVMRTLVFGVSPTDPRTYLILSIFLLTVAALASLIPARRAAKVDPLVAMRAE